MVLTVLATTVRLNIDSCYYSDAMNLIRSTVGGITTLVASLVPFTSRMVTGGQLPLLQNKPLTCDFQQCFTSLCRLLLNLETENDLRPMVYGTKNIQATSKGADQTARMRRLVWALAGRTYRIVGNIMFLLFLQFYNELDEAFASCV